MVMGRLALESFRLNKVSAGNFSSINLKEKSLRDINLQVKKNHRDVMYSIGKVVYIIVITLYGDRFIVVITS